MWSVLIEAFAVTAPAFGLVLAGVACRRLGFLSDRLIDFGSRVVFNVGMPVVLFYGATQADYGHVLKSGSLFVGLIAITVTTVLAYGYAGLRQIPRRDRGVFVQGAYRSNMGILGVALCISAYGDKGLALAALPLAVWTVYYNIIAVMLLNLTLGADRSPWGMLTAMLKNPLIVGIGLGASLALFKVPMPDPARVAGEWSARFFIPFALFCIGGALSLSSLKSSARLTGEASFWRLMLAPLISVVMAVVAGIRGPELGVYFFLLGGPTAAASFVMVVLAGGNGALAANIVVMTTLLSTFSVTLGFYLLHAMGLI